MYQYVHCGGIYRQGEIFTVGWLVITLTLCAILPFVSCKVGVGSATIVQYLLVCDVMHLDGLLH